MDELDQYADLDDECKLAYGLHLQPGFVCRRRGGHSQCGKCAGDLAENESSVVTHLVDRIVDKICRKLRID